MQQAFPALENVDVWVNNAGADVLTGESARWPAERQLEALVELDLKATIRCSPLVAARMRPGGCILNMGWDHATIDGMADDNPELFATVKPGVLGFSKSFARSVAPGVRVNMLCPSWIETAFGADADRAFCDEVATRTPLKRWGRPHDVAGAAVWLASPAAAFVTGQAINATAARLADTLFVTGRLAEPALGSVVSDLDLELDRHIAVLNLSVAALMTTRWIARRLKVSSGLGNIVIPGLCEGDVDPCSRPPAGRCARARPTSERCPNGTAGRPSGRSWSSAMRACSL
jgi:short-subunit dehydrogenase